MIVLLNCSAFLLSCKFLIKIHSQTSPCLWEVWPVLIGTVMVTQGSYTSRYSQEKKAEQYENSWDKYFDSFSIPYKARNIVKLHCRCFSGFNMSTRSCFKQSKEPLRACNHTFNSSYFLLSIPSASRRLLVVSIKLRGTRKLFFVFCRQLSIQHYNRRGQII